MKKKLIASLSCLLVMVWFGCAAQAGEISGMLLNPRGIPAPHIYDSCNILGSNPGGTGTHTNATGNDGIFYHPGLPAGTYSHGFSEKENYEALYFKGLNVPASGNTWHIRQFTPTTFCFGSEWFYSWHYWYAQSFRATGENVISVGLRTAGSDGPDIAVQVLDGDSPSAPQIGPTRTLGYSSTNGQCAYWSAGEVPTVPGQMYTVKLTVAGGGAFSPWHQTVREKMRMENPDGRCWADGVEIDEPLEMTVNQDDKGFTNTMCCARSGSSYWITGGSYAGQTFTARGSSVLMITWLTGSSSLWAVSIHDGVDGSGNPGPQIGPTKYVYGVAWDGRAVVTFAPGEVPTTAGQVYFVKLMLAAGGDFVLYIAKNTNEYSGGRAYVGTTPLGFDYSLGIYEEQYTGSLDKPAVTMSSFRVDGITSTSAVARWSTNRASDSRVDYCETTPYPSSVYDAASVTNHAVPISGLKPNTLYHVRAKSRSVGATDGRTADLTFVTLPASPNVLYDPGFESGAFGYWTKYGSGDIRITGSWLGGSGPRTGSYGLAGAANGTTVQGGAYQRVPAVLGAEYRLSAWYYTHTEVGNFSSKSYQALARIGIDPYGGTDPNAATVRWSPFTYSQDTWSQAAVSAIASSSYVTVFLYGGNDQPITWSIFSFDDVILTTEAIPIAATVAGAHTGYADGTYLQIGDAICTATSAQAGDYFIESQDRSSGLRVRTTDTMSVGERVTVSGIISTRASGERQLTNSAVVSRTSSTPLLPVSVRLKSVGGGPLGPYCAAVPGTSGTYNVGLLARCFGRVTYAAANYVNINDGSLPGNGLRVSTASLTAQPAVGEFVGVTGIVQLQGTSPSSAIPVLRPRSQADCQSVN